jgi:hypothetical protein
LAKWLGQILSEPKLRSNLKGPRLCFIDHQHTWRGDETEERKLKISTAKRKIIESDLNKNIFLSLCVMAILLASGYTFRVGNDHFSIERRKRKRKGREKRFLESNITSIFYRFLIVATRFMF